LPKALNNGLILKINCRVTKLISCDLKKTIKKIVYLDSNGMECFAEAKIIILAASGIGTPRILLNSNKTNNGLANSSDLVGRNLMLHPLGYVEGHFEEELNSNYGSQGCCIISQEFYESDKKRGFSRGYSFQIINGPLPIEAAINFSNRKIIKFGSDFVSSFKSIYNHTAHMTVITEDLPELNNRVTLSSDTKDKFNNPGIKIDYELSENTKKMLIQSSEL